MSVDLANRIPPRNCLIFGSSRSGTSLIAGLLNQAGYFVGDDLLSPSPANESGFFESLTVNYLNDRILEPVMTPPTEGPLLPLWLAVVPLDHTLPSITDPEAARRMLARRPFCIKDPRLSITYPCWKPFLPAETCSVVMVRRPEQVVASLLRGRQLGVWDEFDDASPLLDSWASFYSHILKNDDGRFCYLHFDDLFNGRALSIVEKLLHVRLDREFVKPALAGRAEPIQRSSPRCESIWAELDQRLQSTRSILKSPNRVDPGRRG